MIDGSENAIVSWLLNFRIRMFVKSAVRRANSVTNLSISTFLCLCIAKELNLSSVIVLRRQRRF